MKPVKFIFIGILLFSLSFCSENSNSNKNTSEQIKKEQNHFEKQKNKQELLTVKKLNIVDYFVILQKNKLIEIPCKLSSDFAHSKTQQNHKHMIYR